MMNRGFARVGVPVALALALGACGAGGSAGTASLSAGGSDPAALPSATAVATPGGSNGPVTGHVGQALTFTDYGGDTIVGTLVKVFDPAAPTDASEAPLPSATHWVGVEATIDDHAATFQDDASTFDALTSAGATVTTTDTYQGGSYVLGDGFQGCTAQIHGEQQPYTYCVAFPVPDGQTLTQVGVKVGGAEIGMGLVKHDQASWSIP